MDAWKNDYCHKSMGSKVLLSQWENKKGSTRSLFFKKQIISADSISNGTYQT